ncbi:MAG: hypothetical protein VKK42_13230 [Lyngbya sp.]|nr:hypothetical protein [Lyngbya sp.]
MIRQQLQNLKNTKLLGAICGTLLLGLPFVPKVASAQPETDLDYCFDDFYQEPLNSLVRVPPGCPDNEYTREMGAEEELETEANMEMDSGSGLYENERYGDSDSNRYNRDSNRYNRDYNRYDRNSNRYQRGDRVGVIQPPMPAAQMRTMGNINVDGSTVDVTLNNDTNAWVTYQVIGHTDDRLLYEGSGTELLNLPLPVTITVLREDAGLIDIQDMMADNGEVEFTLQEEGNLTGSEKTIRIQEDGTVFVY